MDQSIEEIKKWYDRIFEAPVSFSKIIKQLNTPILDTLQSSWEVERILFFSFSGTTLSDMKNK